MNNKSMSIKKSESPIIVEQDYDASTEEIWAAITEQGRMVKWFFDNIPDFEPKVGFATRFNIHNEGRDFPHLWKITEVVPFKKITYDWSFEGYEGRSLVTFELFEKNGNGGVRLTSTVIEDFQDGIPEFTRQSGEEGWRYLIQQSLKDYLGKPR